MVSLRLFLLTTTSRRCEDYHDSTPVLPPSTTTSPPHSRLRLHGPVSVPAPRLPPSFIAIQPRPSLRVSKPPNQHTDAIVAVVAVAAAPTSAAGPHLYIRSSSLLLISPLPSTPSTAWLFTSIPAMLTLARSPALRNSFRHLTATRAVSFHSLALYCPDTLLPFACFCLDPLSCVKQKNSVGCQVQVLGGCTHRRCIPRPAYLGPH